MLQRLSLRHGLKNVARLRMLSTMKDKELPYTYQKFNWEDPLDLESQLTEDERGVRDSAREYCQSKLMPRVLMGFRNEQFDREIMRELG